MVIGFINGLLVLSIAGGRADVKCIFLAVESRKDAGHGTPLGEDTLEQLGVLMVDVHLLSQSSWTVQAVHKRRILAKVEPGLRIGDAHQLLQYLVVSGGDLFLRFAHVEASCLLLTSFVHADDAVVADTLLVWGEDVAAGDSLDGSQMPNVAVAQFTLNEGVAALQCHPI